MDNAAKYEKRHLDKKSADTKHKQDARRREEQGSSKDLGVGLSQNGSQLQDQDKAMELEYSSQVQGNLGQVYSPVSVVTVEHSNQTTTDEVQQARNRKRGHANLSRNTSVSKN